MAIISLRHNIANLTKIQSSEINENFEDMINGLTDNTKDHTVLNASLDTLNAGALETSDDLSANNITVDTDDVVFGDKVEITERIESSIASFEDAEEIILDNTNTIAPTKSLVYLGAAESIGSDFSSIVIGLSDTDMEITESGESVHETVSISSATYSGATMAAELQTKMNAALTQTYTVTFSGGLITISSAGNPFTLWTTGGDAIKSNDGRSLFPKIGFRHGMSDGENQNADSQSSVVGNQYEYENLVDTIDVSNLVDGQIVCLRLMPVGTSGNYAPVRLGLSPPYLVDLLLTRNSSFFFMVKKDFSGGPGFTMLVPMMISENFYFSNY